MLNKSIQILQELKYPSGLFAASKASPNTCYHLAWIRDNIYTAMGLEAAKKYNAVKKILGALLDVLLKHEYKIDWAIKEKPKYHYQYIHPRYEPVTFEELWDDCGKIGRAHV